MSRSKEISKGSPVTSCFSCQNRKNQNWSQFATISKAAKFSHQLPFAFTEHGVAMLASVLNSDRAVKMSIFIINTFIRLRQILYTHKELANKVEQIEGRVKEIDQVIKELVIPKPEKKKKIGFLK